jgi:hypothetical protein
MRSISGVSLSALAGLLLLLPACGDERPGSVPDVSEEEITARVAELEAIHEIMQPVWHEAFPARDFAAIQEAVPEFEARLAALDAVQLSGILQDKKSRWDQQKALLMASFQELKQAAEAEDEDRMLAHTEAFHMHYEGMVRIIRPVVPELEVFHQHLYGLYHHYGPGYDLEKIQRAADAMAEAIPPLQAAQLPARLTEHQAHFETAVATLGERVAALQAALVDPSRADVEAAIEAVHHAYEGVEGIFG